MRERVRALAATRGWVLDGNGEATRRQHERGELTARERLDLLLDPGSFSELEQFRRHRATGFGLEDRRPDADAVITGWDTAHGRQVFVYAHDFRVFGGSLGEAHAEKIHKVMDLARGPRVRAGGPRSAPVRAAARPRARGPEDAVRPRGARRDLRRRGGPGDARGLGPQCLRAGPLVTLVDVPGFLPDASRSTVA
jgi:acetyl-CoA carboxylase carboxyltransferase component